tara:strand:- start:1383 stop:1772 length:390 start_codon:yes stop_codon:yes gene_type:complete
MAKLFFYIFNLLFLVLYLYPGSILGLLLYGNINKQPQLTEDFISNFLEVSSNHVYAFMLLSLLGFFNYFNSKKKLIIFYLFFIAIILEIFHIIIPQRSFEISDLNGNIIGISLSLLITYIFYYAKKNFS